MDALFNKIWYHNHPLKYLFLPISWLFCLLVKIKITLYKASIFQSYKSTIPVIVIGNISVGGTGKTPLLIYLVNRLKQAGIKSAVVSRGYGRDNSINCAQVSNKGSTVQQGDEPMLILAETASPVIIANKRVQAIKHVECNCDVDVVFSDDGLQHYQMGRSLQWCVVDKLRGFGNGWCLPAGPLREPQSKLKTFDCVITQNQNNQFDDKEIAFSLEISEAYQLNSPKNKKSLSAFSDKDCIAMAGIGDPERFFDALQKQGFDGRTLVFKDHHQYTEGELAQYKSATLLMTSKDAIKCTQFDLPNAWVVPVSVQTSKALEQQIEQLIKDIQQKVL